MYREDFDSYQGERGAEDIYSKPVKAGKRTYFFDVKSTRGRKDYFVTITESRKQTRPDGSITYVKHKIFLYKEDFEKFRAALCETLDYVKDECFGGTLPVREYDNDEK